MIDVSPFIQVTDFVDAGKLTVTAYKNLAVLEFGLHGDNTYMEIIYALTRSANKNIEYHNEIYFSQGYSTYRNVFIATLENIGVLYSEEYGYVGCYWTMGYFFREYVSLDTPLYISSGPPLYTSFGSPHIIPVAADDKNPRNSVIIDENLWNNAVVTDNNGVVWRGWLCKNRLSCTAFLFSEYGIRPSAKALGEIVTFKRGGQEIDVGPIYFHHYEQDASDKKRVRVFGWTEFPEGDPQLVQEIRFD